jgi:hypothetical protein
VGSYACSHSSAYRKCIHSRLDVSMSLMVDLKAWETFPRNGQTIASERAPVKARHLRHVMSLVFAFG